MVCQFPFSTSSYKSMLVNQGGKIAFEWEFIFGLASLFFYFLVKAQVRVLKLVNSMN